MPKTLTARVKGDGSRVFYSDEEDLQGGQGVKTLRGLLGGGRRGRDTEKTLGWTDRCRKGKIEGCCNPK